EDFTPFITRTFFAIQHCATTANWHLCKDQQSFSREQGRTDNLWGPWAIGDHGAPVSLPKLKKAYEKRYQGNLMGPPTDPDPWAVPEFPNGQSALGRE
ncbi:unnamed protein product, partial [Staurois parvus]